MRSPPPWLLLSVAMLPAPARAQERSLADAIAVARADACLRHALLVEHVRAWLPAESVDARLSVVVHQEEEGASFVLLRDGEAVAVRRFDHLPVGCADRRAALGLAIALALDAAVLDSLAPAHSPARAPRHAPALALEVALETQLLVEVLPEVAAAWQIGARLVFEDMIEIGAAAWVTSISGADLGAGRVSAQLAGARVDLCARRRVESALVLRGCAGGAAGLASGEGHDVPGARESTVGFAGFLGRLGIAVRVTEWLALELAVDAWLALWRPRFDLVDQEGMPVASASLPVGGAIVAIGLGAAF